MPIIPDESLTVQGLSNDSTPKQNKTWTWFSDDVNATYRYVINKNRTHEFTDEEYGTTTTATQEFGDGIYYIHVQARDSLNNVSSVETVYAILDNTGPNITILGSNPVSLYQYDKYIDGGAIAIDTLDSSHISSHVDSSHMTIYVTVKNYVNTSILGNYSVQYTASDRLGNISISTRVVNVLARPSTGSKSGGWSNNVNNNIDDNRNNINNSVKNIITEDKAVVDVENISTEDEAVVDVEGVSSSLNIGSLIKFPDSSTVYLLDENNIKRPYINQDAWNSYFGTDYSPVITVNKTEILDYKLGDPVLYNLGTLIKIQSDPKVYKVTENNTLRWIISEEVAERLYSESWNKLIYDVPEIFFDSYIIGENIE